MAIEVLPVVANDFATMRRFVDSKDGQLSGVAIDHSMPVASDEEAAIRNDWYVVFEDILLLRLPNVALTKCVQEPATATRNPRKRHDCALR